MAEMLIVVAIIAVLSGVAFIAVERHQRGLAQLERNAIAKEIFFAAQNHLTMAESQGYLGVTEFGTPDPEIGKDVYYLTNGGSAPGAGTMLELMLPFGSIDETVRSGGSYLIVYQANPAVVLDVFYCSASGTPTKFNYPSGALPYDTFMSYKDDEGKGSKLPKTGYVVGWYGGGDTGVSGTYITAPSVEIENGDRLIVRVKDANLNLPKDPTLPAGDKYNAKLVLIVSGETVEGKTAKMVFVLRDPETAGFTPNPRVTADPNGTDFTIVLDDITKYASGGDGMHFADLNNYTSTTNADVAQKKVWFMTDPVTGATTPFRPGEDITVEAVAFSNEVLTNIAYSNAVMANSLFADSIVDPSAGSGLSGTGEGHANVNIANIRHLENLDDAISGYQHATFMSLSGEEQVSATQVADLDWKAFADANGAKIYAIGDDSEDKKDGFQPVSPAYKLAYNGRETRTVGESTQFVQHSVKNISVDVDGTAPAGLFGSVAEGGTLSNLELIDFSVKSATGDAGALAGTLANNVTVTNVTAYNTEAFTESTNVTSASGNAGGLVGSMNGATLAKSAAALVVNSTSGTGSAGGLVGATQGGTISGCYAGGHTTNGAYTGVTDGTNAGTGFNVTAAGGSAGGSAGGLIGSTAGTAVSYSYSTCSATGATAGGFAGTVNDGSISNCYATGLVYGSAAEGAFVGSSGTDASYADCLYYEIINEHKVTSTDGTAFNYLPPLGGSATDAGIAALDASTSAYNAFVGAPAEWDAATAYDAQLATYYGGKYNLPTVARLGYGVEQAPEGSEPVAAGQPAAVIPDFVATHRGDWPAPEIFVENE